MPQFSAAPLAQIAHRPSPPSAPQFFVSPLISVDGVEREVNAVDSEHSKNLSSDPWRQLQLAKHQSNPEHPWSHFSTGVGGCTAVPLYRCAASLWSWASPVQTRRDIGGTAPPQPPLPLSLPSHSSPLFLYSAFSTTSGQNGRKHTCPCRFRPVPPAPLPLPPSGSRATLLEEPRAKGLDPRQGVVDFHSQHYSANICRLAVFGKHSLDELEAMVRPRFTEVGERRPRLPFVPHRGEPCPSYSLPPRFPTSCVNPFHCPPSRCPSPSLPPRSPTSCASPSLSPPTCSWTAN